MIAHLDEIPDEAIREAERERLRSICSKCRLGEYVPGDWSISFDAIYDGTLDKVADVAPNVENSCTFDPDEIDDPPKPPKRTTNLTSEDEDALRQFLATAVGLDPLSVVVALHAARRSGKTAAQAVRDFAAEVRSYNKNATKQTFHHKWKSTVGKIPELAAIHASGAGRRGG